MFLEGKEMIEERASRPMGGAESFTSSLLGGEQEFRQEKLHRGIEEKIS